MSKPTSDSRTKAARIVVQRLESLQRAGISHLSKARTKSDASQETPKLKTATAAQGSAVRAPRLKDDLEEALDNKRPAGSGVGQSLFGGAPSERQMIPAEDRPAALEIIRQEVAGCTRCSELTGTRTQTVFGVGSPTARICFIGEAPGADEDRLGEPFVGRAGQLLTKMIQACGLKREEVYILNVLKCRPPQNRTPLPDEVSNCRGYLERQLEIIRPEVICCLGAVAAQAVLTTERSIGKLRGTFHEYLGIPVICSYHPAYLLRNPAAKVDAWEDLKTMMRRLGVELK
jgi:uracil-DNA glycosylase